MYYLKELPKITHKLYLKVFDHQTAAKASHIDTMSRISYLHIVNQELFSFLNLFDKRINRTLVISIRFCVTIQHGDSHYNIVYNFNLDRCFKRYSNDNNNKLKLPRDAPKVAFSPFNLLIPYLFKGFVWSLIL